MSGPDDDRGARPDSRPGFLRRLFGGGAATESATGAEQPPPTPIAPTASEFVPPPLDTVDMDAFAREALAEVLPWSAHEAIAPLELTPAEAPEPIRDDGGGSWWSRLRKGLSRSSSSLGQGLSGIFTKRRLDLDTIEDLEDLLIRADLGVATALKIVDQVREGRFEKGIGAEDVQTIIAAEVERVLGPIAQPLVVPRGQKPFVILVIGVNGSGKTTTIGKLAAKLTREGRSVMLAAGDTFRAAAVEQLRVWGERIGAPVVMREAGADAAGLAFDAMKAAAEAGTDVLLIDTAGRLQNRTELMEELAKVLRVVRKIEPEAPHAVLLVLDATVGQNALSQVDIFGRVAGVTGLVMTKLDGTARGGILVAIAEKYRLPVHFIGVGEGIDDLEPFAARDFARAIAGLDR